MQPHAAALQTTPASEESFRARTEFFESMRRPPPIDGLLEQYLLLGKESKYTYSVSGLLENAASDYGANNEFWIDTYFAFALWGRYAPLAVIGFDPIEDGICVRQIQGADEGGLAAELSPFRWERMLLRYVVNWAAQSNLSFVAVQPGEQHEWARPDNVERLKRRYNGSAKKEKFKFDKERGLYVLPLQ